MSNTFHHNLFPVWIQTGLQNAAAQDAANGPNCTEAVDAYIVSIRQSNPEYFHDSTTLADRRFYHTPTSFRRGVI
jgi:hypothetical protein